MTAFDEWSDNMPPLDKPLDDKIKEIEQRLERIENFIDEISRSETLKKLGEQHAAEIRIMVRDRLAKAKRY